MKDKYHNIKKLVLSLCPIASITWCLTLLNLVMYSELTGLFRISIICAALAFGLLGFVPLLNS